MGYSFTCSRIIRHTSVPWRAVSLLHAAQRRREDYLATLRENLPAFQEAVAVARSDNATDSTSDPFQSAQLTWVDGGVLRESTSHCVRRPAIPFALPDQWVEKTTETLCRVLHGIVDAVRIQQQDYFLCALIHPTYYRKVAPGPLRTRESRRQRAQVAMPYELLQAGAAGLRLLHEVNVLPTTARPAPPLTSHRLLAVATRCSVPQCVLFDPTAALTPPGTAGRGVVLTRAADGTERRVPEVVVGDAFTALCGAVSLVGGTEGLARLLDRHADTAREAD